MQNLVILGSSGSIGTQTIDLIRDDPEFKVIGLAVHSSIVKLKEQVELLNPKAVCIYDKEKANEFAGFGLDVKILSGMEGLLSLCEMEECDTVVVALVGMIGIQPAVAALEAGKCLALANKESLVCAGHILMPLAKKSGREIRPIDSEHSAIWQCLRGEDPTSVERILLTASGGPFRGRSRESLQGVKKEDALRHPNWSMGAKISIDSATMVNKALEVMEASWLFSVPIDKIQVIVHPESIIHSAVMYKDGSVKAQLGPPDMHLPISYALNFPQRKMLESLERLDLMKIASLNFEKPDLSLFKGFKLGIKAAKRGGSMPTVYNAANEEAVALFLSDRISFLDIPESIEKAMEKHEEAFLENPDLSEILNIEKWARGFVRELYELI